MSTNIRLSDVRKLLAARGIADPEQAFLEQARLGNMRCAGIGVESLSEVQIERVHWLTCDADFANSRLNAPGAWSSAESDSVIAQWEEAVSLLREPYRSEPRITAGETIGDIVVPMAELDRLWPKGDSKARSPAKHPGGRPEKYDWAAFDREVVRLANTPDGLPDRARLQRHMLEWCAAHWPDEPSERAVRDRISGRYPD